MSLLSFIGIEPLARINDNVPQQYSRRLLQEMLRGAYANCEKMLSEASAENRNYLIEGFAAHEKSVPLSMAWTERHQDSSFAHLLAGASLIVTAWKIRGGSYAEDVDSGAWQPFFDHLDHAEAVLYRAANLDDGLAEPYAWRILAKVGQGAPTEEIDALFEAALERDPWHCPSYNNYFLATTEKWGGSHQAMFEFSRNCFERSPRGSKIHALVAQAYNEYALAEEKKTLGSIKGGAREEIIPALYAWLDAAPGELQRRLPDADPGCLNHFAVACYLSGAADEAAMLVRSLRREIWTIPWAWIAKNLIEEASPALVFNRVCRDLGIYREIAGGM
jgi:hypothetical protein